MARESDKLFEVYENEKERENLLENLHTMWSSNKVYCR